MDASVNNELRNQLQLIEARLADLQARWPAHSLKPAQMVELEELEEERDRLERILAGVQS